MAKEKKMSAKEWLKEYAPDMGYKFVDKKQGGKHYFLVDPQGKATAYTSLEAARTVVLKALHRYIGEHTTIVDSKGKVLEMSDYDKKRLKR